MNCPTNCRHKKFPIFTIDTIAVHPNPLRFNTPATKTDLLIAVQQIAQNTQAGEWEACKLEQYFGPASRSLQFKEILLPFVWAARQQVIKSVGARYQQWPLSQRVQRELELLVILNTTLEEAYKKLDKSNILKTEVATEIIFQMAISGIFVQSSQIVLKMVEIASHWVDSAVELLDIF